MLTDKKKEELKNKVIKNLKNVFDPEIPVNVYDLGLIYEIYLEEKNNYLYCYIDMTLTSPACPVVESLVEQVKYVSLAVEEVDEAGVKLTFSPPWNQDMISQEGKEIMAVSGAVI